MPTISRVLTRLTRLAVQSLPRGVRWRHVLASPDIVGFAEHLKECRNVVVLAGAGLSTAAGLPDFRTPGTGLYAALEKFKLPYPESIFDLDHFRNDPRAFLAVGRDLMPRPALFQPTLGHYFVRQLSDQGRLLRLFSQNVDGLEYLAGIPDERVVTAHGSFRGGHCAGSDNTRPCGHRISAGETRRIMLSGKIEDCVCPRCQIGYMKPDIVFFSESMPEDFWYRAEADLPKADALIVMGTSLQVFPFAGLVDDVPRMVPRLLINKTLDGPFRDLPEIRDAFGRDAVYQGSCDDGVKELARLCGFGETELVELADRERAMVKEFGESLAATQDGEAAFWNGLPWLEGKDRPPGLPKPRP
ncbi:SIRT2 protein [Hyaloraphidium curvatum]|nr:SIRT2 protein [Hyaloraphidium curvatum]